jgi:hypothetical protein
MAADDNDEAYKISTRLSINSNEENSTIVIYILLSKRSYVAFRIDLRRAMVRPTTGRRAGKRKGE